MSQEPSDLTSGRRLSINAIWNLLGFAIPLVVALIAIPILVEGLGTARFGILTMAWVIVGYFSLFDLGLSRALTKLVAEKLGEGRTEELPTLIWSAMIIMTLLGLLGAVVAALLSPWLVNRVINIPEELRAETLIAFYLLSLSLPSVISSAGFRGILEAYQRFRLITVIRVFLGTMTFLGPLVVLPFSHSLVPVIAALVFSRLISWALTAFFCSHVVPGLMQSFRVEKAVVKQLVGYGGWMTVTNLVGPLMTYLDRFFIGATVSIVAVAYYATPYEVVTKLSIIPQALMGVIFPAFATALVYDRARADVLFYRTLNYIYLSLVPLVLAVIIFAHEGLMLWLGPEFADNSMLVMQLLAIGVLINSLAYVPFGLIQSAGRPDLTAKLHLAEFPVYILLLYWLLSTYGILGAAIAWVMRAVIDAVLLFHLANRFLSSNRPQVLLTLAATTVVVLIMPINNMLLHSIFEKLVFFIVIILLFALLGWRSILDSIERKLLINRIKLLSVRLSRIELK